MHLTNKEARSGSGSGSVFSFLLQNNGVKKGGWLDDDQYTFGKPSRPASEVLR